MVFSKSFDSIQESKEWRINMNKQKFYLVSRWSALFVAFLLYHPLVAFDRVFPFIPVDSIMSVQSESFLIDDFSNSDGLSTFGTRWRMFTDQVMGGISSADWNYVTIDGRKGVQLKGTVSLANNGGFIQIALPLANGGWPFDASSYKGVRLWARGNGKAYHIHLRSSDSRLPWQYYGAEFIAVNRWRMFDIPFSDFEPENLTEELKSNKLTRIALVATKKEYKADIAIARLEFYR